MSKIEAREPLPRQAADPVFFNPGKDGGASRDRTDDLKLAKLALSQLSYGPSANVPNVHTREGRCANGGGPRRS